MHCRDSFRGVCSFPDIRGPVSVATNLARRNDKLMTGRFIAILMLLGMILPGACGVTARADDAVSQSFLVDAGPVPEAFDKSAPASIDQLRDMQQHLVKLIPKLSECTVNLQIGNAQGSGVIVSKDGYILTAAHVSGRPGNTVSITMNNGKRYRGTSLGRNTMLDASIIKIESNQKEWPYCEMAETLPEPGDWCLVIAHPGGYQKERGLVTRLGRVMFLNRWMVQSDCELIGGDSGGPLFGMDGRVIGVNTRIGESTDANFHVPITAYTEDWDRLIASEDFKTHSGAYLGVSVVPKENSDGMEITEVYPGDPADRAGLLKGDTLLTFQSRRINKTQQLIDLIGEQLPGESVKLVILRDGTTLDLTVRLGMRRD